MKHLEHDVDKPKMAIAEIRPQPQPTHMQMTRPATDSIVAGTELPVPCKAQIAGLICRSFLARNFVLEKMPNNRKATAADGNAIVGLIWLFGLAVIGNSLNLCGTQPLGESASAAVS